MCCNKNMSEGDGVPPLDARTSQATGVLANSAGEQAEVSIPLATNEATGSQEDAGKARSKEMIDALTKLNGELGGKLIKTIKVDMSGDEAVLLNHWDYVSVNSAGDERVIVYGVDPNDGAFSVTGEGGMLLAKRIDPGRVHLPQRHIDSGLSRQMDDLMLKSEIVGDLKFVNDDVEQKAWNEAFGASKSEAEESLVEERAEREAQLKKSVAQDGILSAIKASTVLSAEPAVPPPVVPGPMV